MPPARRSSDSRERDYARRADSIIRAAGPLTSWNRVRVLLAANDATSWTTVAELSTATGLSEPLVARCIRELRSAGLIEVKGTRPLNARASKTKLARHLKPLTDLA